MENTTVTPMPCVTIPGDPITVHVKMDLLDMEKIALVIIKIENEKDFITCFIICFS